MAELATFANTTATLEVASGYLLGLAPDTNKVVTDVKGWYSGAAVRRESVARMSAHGNFSERGYRDARYPGIGGMFTAVTRAEAAAFVDEINAFLGDGTEGVLTVSDVDLGTRSAKVYLMTPEVTWDGGLDVQFFLDMEAPDPRKYGATITTSTGVPEQGGGLIFPLFAAGELGTEPGTGMLNFGDPGESGVATIANEGKADTPVTATVTGPVVNGFTITELSTGRKLVYTATILEGQYLVLDSRTGTVKLNGYSDRAVYLTTRDWMILGGGQSSSYLFDAPGSPDARLTLEVAPAWW